MNAPRASAILLAALAAGAGGRIFLDHMEARSQDGAPRSSNVCVRKPAVTSRAATLRRDPGAAAVLSAYSVARLRLLIAWLPEDGEQALLTKASERTMTVEDDD